MPKPKRGLGKGLEALFADNDTPDIAVSTLPIDEIEPNAEQPRREFSPESLSQLAASITEHGVLQPLVVRPMLNGRYQIVAGERRWRASRIAGLTELPVVVRELNDEQAFELALVENLVRADLNPIEEAEGYRTLIERFSMTQERVAQRVGRSRPAVANALRLLSLPSAVLEALKKGNLSAGHARALLPLSEKAAAALAERIVAEGLSVRQTEQLAKHLQEEAVPEKPRSQRSIPYYREMELALGGVLSRRVKISPKGANRGELTLEFFSKEELAALGKLLETFGQKE